MTTEPTIPPKKQSFWTTLPGILTQLTALIVAIGGLFAVLYPQGYRGSDRSHNPTASPSASATTEIRKLALERIRRGEQFHVTLSNSFGDLQAGETYTAWYSPSLRQMFVTGFAATVKQPNFTNKYPCPNIDHGHINLWGHSFSIEDGEIVDDIKGPSGKIYFDDGGQ